jgi:hypothetical protein
MFNLYRLVALKTFQPNAKLHAAQGLEKLTVA